MDRESADLRQFLGGMDFDSDDKSVEPNMYRLLINGRNGPRKKGVIENIQGNILIPNAGLPTSGINRCKGGYEDIEGDSFIFLNYNSEGYHGIYRYYINKPGYVNGVIEQIVRVEHPQAYTFDFPNPLDFKEDGYITSVNLVGDMLYWSDPDGRPKKLDIKKANDTAKKRKFNICFNKSSFDKVVQYTLNVYEFSNPVPVGTMTWNSGGTSYYQKCDEFQTAYDASALSSLFTIDNCGQYIEIEMTSTGKYFVNISEVELKSLQVNVDGYAIINAYLIRCAVNPGLAIFDQVVLYGLDQLSILNGVTQTIIQLPPSIPNSAQFNAPAFGADIFGDPGKMLYLPIVVTNPNPNQSMVVPENFYPDIDLGLEAAGIKTYDYLRYDLFDRLKYPPDCQPTCQYGTDAKREINLVKNLVFQFRAKYIYDNYENSVYGSVSNIPIVGISCDDSKNFGDTNNYIDVDFMDQRLNNPSTVSIIKKVVLAVREHNNGEWREVKVFEQHEFAGIGQNIYRFFNDQTYNAISANEINKPYDSIGKKVGATDFVDDRLFDGDILEGYDKPCLDAEVLIDYEVAPVDVRFTIRGRLYIRQAFYTSGAMAAQQPIWVPGDQADPKQVCFGGMGRDLVLNEEWIGGNDMINRYKQDIPLSGFVFYLAGTDYYGITRQHATNVMNNNKVYQGTSRPQRNEIRDEINNGNVYHDFEITGVPPGRYVLRIASHHTTQADLYSTNRSYQKTSTYTFNVGGSGYYEKIIDITNADVDLGISNGNYSEVADLSSPQNFISGFNASPVVNGYAAVNFCGYFVDHDLGVLPQNYEQWLQDTRIEKAVIKGTTNVSLANAFLGFLLANAGALVLLWEALDNDTSSVTDHNGFFWIPHLAPFAALTNIDHAEVGAFQSTNTVVIGTDNNAWTGKSDYGTAEICVRNYDDAISQFGRTFLNGRAARSNTNPVEGIAGASVVNTHGNVVKTDVNGYYRVHTYVDTPRQKGWVTPSGNLRIDQVIVFEGSPLCKTDPPYVAGPYSLLIEAVTIGSPPQYDYANEYTFVDFLFNIIASATSINAEKRGSDIIYGVAYYDEGDRRCAVVTTPELQKHFLFYTEKDPLTGKLAPYGKPIVSWRIHSEPPDWAVKYQWVRTANLQLNNWLQWGINRAIYITKNQTDFSVPSTFEDADFCVLDLQSIGYYSIIDHPDAIINFTFQQGDRVRFIADENGNFFQNYYDYEIVRVLGNNFVYVYKDNTFEIKAGYLFEVYTPRNKSPVNLFYEFGECYQVKTAVINGVRRKYHAGHVQDQSFGPLPALTVTPASGVFKTGSAYYRRRQFSTQATLPNIDPPVMPTSGGPKVISVDDPAVSDFYLSNDYSIGRVLSSSETIGEIHRGSAIRFSGRFIEGTKVNNLSSFDALNEKQFSNSFGNIVRLVLRDNTVLVAIFSNSYTVSMYINQGILRESQGAGLVAISDDVIPRTQISQRTFGSTNPESIYLNDEADLFGWDEKQGVPWRMSGNGMIELSDYKANNYFKPKGSLRILKDRKKSRTPAVYDLNFDEYILSFNELGNNPGIAPQVTIRLPFFDTASPSGMKIIITVVPLNIVLCQFTVFGNGNTATITTNLINLTAQTSGNGFSAVVDANGDVVITAPNNAAVYGNGALVVDVQGASIMSYQFTPGQVASIGPVDEKDTMVFIKTKNLWPQKYEFYPEYFGRIRNEIMMFVDGNLWLSHRNPLYNNFFGVQHTRKLTIVTNKDWEKVKNYLNIAQSAENINWCPDITIPPGPNSPIGMKSRILKARFKTQQNKQYANFQRDLNTPNALNPDWALINGRPLIGQSMTIIMEDDSVEASTIMSAKIHYFWSEYS